jgi:hypothetical protein
MGRHVEVGGFGGIADRDRAGIDPPSLEAMLTITSQLATNPELLHS